MHCQKCGTSLAGFDLVDGCPKCGTAQSETPRTDDARIARQLERELNEANRQANMLQGLLNKSAQERDAFRMCAENLALRLRQAMEYCEAIDAEETVANGDKALAEFEKLFGK